MEIVRNFSLMGTGLSIAQICVAAATEHYGRGLFWTAGALTCLVMYTIISVNRRP